MKLLKLLIYTMKHIRFDDAEIENESGKGAESQTTSEGQNGVHSKGFKGHTSKSASPKNKKHSKFDQQVSEERIKEEPVTDNSFTSTTEGETIRKKNSKRKRDLDDAQNDSFPGDEHHRKKKIKRSTDHAASDTSLNDNIKTESDSEKATKKKKEDFAGKSKEPISQDLFKVETVAEKPQNGIKSEASIPSSLNDYSSDNSEIVNWKDSSQSKIEEIEIDIPIRQMSGTNLDSTDDTDLIKNDDTRLSPISILEQNTVKTPTQSDDEVEEQTLRNPNAFGVIFSVPPLHKLLNRASKPTPEQRDAIRLNGWIVKYGKFSEIEDKQILKNFQEFVMTFRLRNEPSAYYNLTINRVKKEAKANFLWWLSKDLPERTPYSVFKRFKLLTNNVKKGKFTKREDKLLLNPENNDIETLTEVAAILGRTPQSVENRLKILKRDVHDRRIKWRNQNAVAFIQHLMKVMKVKEVDQLKTVEIKLKHWKKLSKKLDNVPIRILKRAWMDTIYSSIFFKDDVEDLIGVKLKLIEMLKNNNETDWRTVNWSNYATKFDGMTSLKVYMIIHRIVERRVPESKRHKLRKCLKYLSKLTRKDFRPRRVCKLKIEDFIK